MFNIGDKVRYVNHKEVSAKEYPKIGEIVTVKSSNSYCSIKLEEYDWHYNPDSFELVKEENMFKVGDKVTPFLECGGLTIGKTYTIEKVENKDLYTIDDKGHHDGWFADRFKLVKEDPIVAAKELLEKNGYKVEIPTSYHLVLNGAGFNIKLHDDKTSMKFDSDWLYKADVVTLMEHMQKLLDQMV